MFSGLHQRDGNWCARPVSSGTRHSSSAMRGIGPPVHFELHAQWMAECRGLAPLARRHALVSTEARFACPVDIPNWCPWPDSHRHCRRFELPASALGYTGVGAHGWICTNTVRVLSALPLRWATWANWCRVKDLHPQPPRSERGASSCWANAAGNWHSRQESHLQPPRSKRGALMLELRER